ncbi:MAG: hypothetical protein A2901_06735 [Elusimicrobia bacterium RIFCSPLOWO2_01_FULL_54_10]|nr:MAG: hypothetical protein A2901_06735 [Elusimicrobia bacterium RIFCSPLOWO2_01_FULL_54_10]
MISAITDAKERAMGFSVMIRDFTERKKSDEKLQMSLRDKETMLKEIHHRVKNNLQVISSLLRLQSENAQDPKTLALFKDSQERVHAMAMVHEYLYQSPDLAHINFPRYVENLVRNLCRSYGPPLAEDHIQIQVDPVLLSLDVAVPCGLLLTELVSNALKYAYPDRSQGPISVCFRELHDHTYVLTVSDQGVGLPPDLDWRNTTSLGLRLVRILTDQIHGHIWLEQDNGTQFVVTIRDPKNGKRLHG